MKTYYIYHITGIKIGCTSDLQKRMADQGFTSWNILEEHTDIYLASDREIQLQKEYGLPVDKTPYFKTIVNRHKWSDMNPAVLVNKKRLNNTIANGGKGNRVVSFELAEEIRSKYIPRKYTQGMLAKEYNLPIITVINITRGVTYVTP